MKRGGRDRRHAGSLACAAVVVLALTVVGPAAVRAEPAHVILLQPAGASPGARRCLTLIREELVGGGFEVDTIDPGPARDPFSLSESMQSQHRAVATIGLVGDPEVGRAEIWILDRTGDKAEVRRLPAPPEEAGRVGEVLAVRTIEALRASALKLLVEGSRPAPAPAPPSPVPVEVKCPPAGPAPSRRVVALETGVSLLHSSSELEPAVVPLASLLVASAGPLLGRLTVAGLGTRSRLQTSRGTATIDQELGLFELGAAFRRDRVLSPVVTLGGGVLHVRSDAQGVGPYVGRRDARWSALFGIGGGLVGAFGRQVAVALQAHLMLAAPYPVIRFAGLDAAQLARPTVWLTLTLVSWL
ncbi:MAG TPA: hypothetical protein VIU64_14985 [Polyangia bacterium]